jgi:hypothetical protein
MSRVIFFGDSYTKGHGCLPGYEYYNSTPVKAVWTDLIANELGYSKIDFSDTGKSNENIIKGVLDFSKDIKNGDILIVGTTSAVRTSFFIGDKLLNFSGRKARLTYQELVKEQGNRLPSNYTEELHTALCNYVLDVKLPFYDYWDGYYSEIYKSLETIFKKNILVWEYKVWFNFETITEHTQGKIKDGHWSWNGHEQFYNYLIPKLREKFF